MEINSASYLQQLSSSEPSPQSFSPSHFQPSGMHFSDLHLNCPAAQRNDDGVAVVGEGVSEAAK